MAGLISSNTKKFNYLVIFPAAVLFIGAFSKTLSFDNAVIDIIDLFPSIIQLNKIFAVIITVILIITELFAAIFLLLYKKYTYSIIFALSLFMIFIFINLLKIINNGNTECGCFGEIINANTYTILIVDIIMLNILLFLLKKKNN